MAAKICPILKEECIEHRCQLYVQVMGVNPQTGQEINEWGCSIAWLVPLLIENSQTNRQTGVAVEQVRNVMARTGEVVEQVALAKLAPETSLLIPGIPVDQLNRSSPR